MAENQEVLRQALLSDLAAPRKPRQDLDHCADAANWKSQDKSRTHPSEQFAIGSQHEEDFDGNDLAPVQDVTCVQN